MKIVAVVFDMDGVLFDTERIGVQSLPVCKMLTRLRECALEEPFREPKKSSWQKQKSRE